MRPSRLLPAALALLLLGAACPTAPAGRDDLREARTRWTSQRISHYRYDFQRSCFCPMEAVRPVTIEVLGDSVVSVRDRATGQPLPTVAFGRRWPTVQDLFAELERAVRDADSLEATYDVTTGHPVRARIDWIRNAVDDESEFTAGNLQRLE